MERLNLHRRSDGAVAALGHCQPYTSVPHPLSNSGEGHLYQARLKSFSIADDDHFLVVCRYVESNPPRAGLVIQTEDCVVHSEVTLEWGNQPNAPDWITPSTPVAARPRFIRL